MNAADMMLLERMQQMAASMAVPQIGGGQSVQPKTTKDGASFQDLMDRAQSAKDNSTASSKPQEQDQKTEQVEEKAPAQEVKESQFSPSWRTARLWSPSPQASCPA